MRVLGVETSCDETGIAIYDSQAGLLANALYSQSDIHAAFGGIVPELASRDHVRKILPLLNESLSQAQLEVTDLQGIAFTKGPGLVGALMIGAMFSRALGLSLNVPTVGVHHLEGHIMASFLESDYPDFPFLALLVSGGHTELIKAHAFGHYEVIGDTLDDAVGEAFDKTAKLLGFPYPGGPTLAAIADRGQPGRFNFPRPMIDRPGLDFSFSGLKTYALNTISGQTLDDQTRADIAHAFQTAVVSTLVIKCRRALTQTGFKRLIIAGGVGANSALRTALYQMAEAFGAKLFFPRPAFCTDNGAMIAYVGCQRLMAGERENLSVMVKPRWRLTELNPLHTHYR